MHCLGILTSIFPQCSCRGRWSTCCGYRKKLQAISVGQIWRPVRPRPRSGDQNGIFPHQAHDSFMRYSLILNAISFISFGVAVAFLVTRGLSRRSTSPVARSSRSLRRPPISSRSAARSSKRAGANSGSELRHLTRRAYPPHREGDDFRAGRARDETLKARDSTVELKRRIRLAGGRWSGARRRWPLLVVVGIMIYLAFRFEWKFSVAAIVANLHDVARSGCSPSSVGNSRHQFWRPCWRCSATRSTSR